MAFTILYLLLSILTAVLLGCIGCFLYFIAYLHYIHKINDHLPGPPRSSFVLGHMTDVWKYKAKTGKTRYRFLLEKRLEYGPIFVLFFFHRAVVFLGDPEYLRYVYINNHSAVIKDSFFHHKIGFIYGERGAGYGLPVNTDKAVWSKRRRVMNPAFHRKCLKDFIVNFNEVCDRFMKRMETVVDEGRPTSMVQEFAKVTIEAISQVSFNINTKAIEDPNSPFPAAIRSYLKAVQDNFEIPVSPTLLAIFQFKLFQSDTKREQINAARFLRKFASGCVTARMKDIEDKNEVPEDLLTILIKDGSLSMDDVIDEFLAIFIAGQETTTNSLGFALYSLLKNPHIELKLQNELNEVLGERDYVEFHDLSKLKYLGQVFDESLRRYPVILAPNRMLLKDITVGGYRVPKGTNINSHQIFYNMNPEVWKDPEVFDPERFSNVENIPNFSMTHFPFSIGPRNCIGQTFARFESKVILAKLLRRFQFTLLPGQTDAVEARLTLTPRDGVVCKVSRR